MPEQQRQPKSDLERQRPFPWHCPKCRRKEVRLAIVSYRCDAAHDGRLYSVTVPELNVPRCGHCGELVFNYPADEQVRQALRSQLHLLAPDEIRAARAGLGLTQKELADRLGVDEEIVSRWETGGQIQSRAMDNLLRVYFALPEARSLLLGIHPGSPLGMGVVSGPADR